MRKKTPPIAESIGKGLAHFQSFVDDILAIGFKKLSKLESQKTEKKKKTYGRKAIFYTKKAASFLGKVGSSFYKHYEDIKIKKKTKSMSQKK